MKRLWREKSSATAYLIDEEGGVGKADGAKTTAHMFVIDPAIISRTGEAGQALASISRLGQIGVGVLPQI
jgi:hypothetical protein